MKKLIFGLLVFFTVFFFIGWLISENAKLKRDVKILSDSNVALGERNEELNKRIDSLNVPYSSEVIYHAKDFRTKDFFTFLKISRAGEQVGYEIITDLPDIDRHAFDFMYKVCLDSAIDIPFFLETWWTESRCGTNLAHGKNKDGTVDGGHLGINHKDPKQAMKGTPYTDIYQFIKKYRKFEKFPRKQWRSRYSSKVLWLKDLQTKG